MEPTYDTQLTVALSFSSTETTGLPCSHTERNSKSHNEFLLHSQFLFLSDPNAVAALSGGIKLSHRQTQAHMGSAIF